jgi:anti-sigma factor ChrR (cupin superfamily)
MGDGKRIRELNAQLHAMSQPMTVLLCAMEYAAGLDSVQEMKETVRVSQEACERLRKNVTTMQAMVREAIEEGAGDERALGSGHRPDL